MTATPDASTLDRPATGHAGHDAPEPCDVLIIGGGPAGSTAAALLAERGLDVVMLERDAHPRFHIGESLLPRNLQIIDRLGLRAEVAAMGVLKPGAEFVSDETGASTTFPFANSMNQKYTYAYQVRRADFDALLFGHARATGARATENARVTDVSFRDDGTPACVTAEIGGRTRQFAPRYLLDASGRDTFLAGRFGTKEANKLNTTAAVYAHYRGVAARSGALEGYITVHLAPDGWFWLIPLPDGVMSVGFVGNQSAFKGRRGSMADLFEQRLASSPTVSARMADAERISDIQSAGNYSYRARTSHGDGYMMIGDAYAFVDPVFSSGVLLAMQSGELAAGVAETWLDDRAAGRARARAAEREMRQAMDSLAWLIYRINSPVLRDMFMSPKNTLRMRDGIVTLLTGNLGRSLTLLGPVLALKSVFYAMSFFYRLGYRLQEHRCERPLGGETAVAQCAAD